MTDDIPFTRRAKPPHDIEKEIYSKWAKLLKNKIKPELMISGHIHRFTIEYPGDELDELGHPCPVMAGSWVKYPHDTNEYGYSFVGAGIILKDKSIKVVFNDDNGTFFKENVINI